MRFGQSRHNNSIQPRTWSRLPCIMRVEPFGSALFKPPRAALVLSICFCAAHLKLVSGQISPTKQTHGAHMGQKLCFRWVQAFLACLQPLPMVHLTWLIKPVCGEIVWLNFSCLSRGSKVHETQPKRKRVPCVCNSKGMACSSCVHVGKVSSQGQIRSLFEKYLQYSKRVSKEKPCKCGEQWPVWCLCSLCGYCKSECRAKRSSFLTVSF